VLARRFCRMELRQLPALFVFPNLIAVATRRKQVSSFPQCGSVLSVAHHFGAHFIVLSDAVVLTNPGNVRKHSTKRRAYKLLLASHTFSQALRLPLPKQSLHPSCPETLLPFG
jgi:hypothetical protein